MDLATKVAAVEAIQADLDTLSDETSEDCPAFEIVAEGVNISDADGFAIRTGISAYEALMALERLRGRKAAGG